MTLFWRDTYDPDPSDQAAALDCVVRQLRGTRMRQLPVRPRSITLREAQAFLDHVHRHHKQIQGWKFGVGIEDEVGLVGVVVVGRPVARMLDDSRTLEITRCCVMDNVDNGASMLLGRACRAARELGYTKIITYTMPAEPGTSLKAAGFTLFGKTKGGQWSRANRRRKRTVEDCEKQRWEKSL